MRLDLPAFMSPTLVEDEGRANDRAASAHCHIALTDVPNRHND